LIHAILLIIVNSVNIGDSPLKVVTKAAEFKKHTSTYRHSYMIYDDRCDHIVHRANHTIAATADPMMEELCNETDPLVVVAAPPVWPGGVAGALVVLTDGALVVLTDGALVVLTDGALVVLTDGAFGDLDDGAFGALDDGALGVFGALDDGALGVFGALDDEAPTVPPPGASVNCAFGAFVVLTDGALEDLGAFDEGALEDLGALDEGVFGALVEGALGVLGALDDGVLVDFGNVCKFLPDSRRVLPSVAMKVHSTTSRARANMFFIICFFEIE